MSRLGRFIVADFVLILFGIALLLVLQVLNVDVSRNELLLVLFGPHGVVFGTLLPLAVVALVVAAAIWLFWGILARLMR